MYVLVLEDNLALVKDKVLGKFNDLLTLFKFEEEYLKKHFGYIPTRRCWTQDGISWVDFGSYSHFFILLRN